MGSPAIRSEEQVEIAAQVGRQCVMEDVTSGAGGDNQQPDPEEPRRPSHQPAPTILTTHLCHPFLVADPAESSGPFD
jgi:hypothetical protein